MCAFLNHRPSTAWASHRKKHSTLTISYTQMEPSLSSHLEHPWPNTQTQTHRYKGTCTHAHTCARTHTHTHVRAHTHTHTLLKRGLHYTGITKRNVLIKLCRQLQTARRETGNDVVHQALKENASRGLCVCAYSSVPLFTMPSWRKTWLLMTTQR